MRNQYRQRAADAVRRFARDEAGSFIIFTMFILVAMMLAVGVGIDTLRAEVMRTKLQNTTDRAVLAAADLENDRTPKEVVHDYFLRNGLEAQYVSVDVKDVAGERVVTASTAIDVKSVFLNMIGVNKLTAPAIGTAEESVTDVEIALVLDNSGSMGSNNRINLLKAAAKDFVDTVVRAPDETGTVAISIVPFATQVNAGAKLAKYYNFSNEHNRSACADFKEADFTRRDLPVSLPIQRTGHFDGSSTNSKVYNGRLVCAVEASRQIFPWSHDKKELKAMIDSMYPNGWTSIDVGAKWGLSLLDPSARPVLSGLIQDGHVHNSLQGQPYAYGRNNTLKVLVVMSDGQNTNQWLLKDGYRSGASTLWKNPADGTLSYYWKDRGSSQKFYNLATASWQSQPAGGNNADNLEWQDVWELMPVKTFARDVVAAARGGNASTYRNQIMTQFGGGKKNPRTSKICKTARDAGVVIYTIGMDTYGQGDATLDDCVGEVKANFFDVEAQAIDEAFAAIARQINQLRLTQ